MKNAGFLSLLFLLLLNLSCTPSEEPPLVWWKGNTHTHTLWSDGDAAPERVAKWYKEHGYQFLVLSDHNVLSEDTLWFPVVDDSVSRLTPARLDELRQTFGADAVQTRQRDDRVEMRLKTLAELRIQYEEPGAFLFIQGEEVTDRFEDKPVHINGLNLLERIEPQGGTSVREVMQRNVDQIIEQGRRLQRPTLAHINHPNFVWGLTPEDVASIKGERFFEVYNGHPAVYNYGDEQRPGMEELWDIALTLRLTELDLGVLFGLATDDSHNYFNTGTNYATSGRGWVMVQADSLKPSPIINALKAGRFYATSGVLLDRFDHDADRFQIQLKPETGITYTTRFIGTRMTDDGPGPVGELLSETTGNPAVYTFTGDELYVRATIVSSKPHPNPYQEGDMESAWVQPVVPDHQ